MGVVVDFIAEMESFKLDNEIKLIPASDIKPEYYSSDNGIIRSEFYNQGNKVIFESKGRKFSWTPSAMKYVDEFGTEDSVYNVQDVPLETKANYARFNRSMPDVDDWFIAENNRLKHQILLQGFQRDPLPWLFGNIDFVFGGVIEFDSDLRVQADGLVITGSFETDGDINILDQEGNSIFRLPKIVAYDSKIPDRAMAYGRYRVNTNVDGALSFDIVVDNAWISDVERVYPIVIDPTLIATVSPSDSTLRGSARPIVLSNGWWILQTYHYSTDHTDYYVSKDDGASFSLLTTAPYQMATGGGICSSGTMVYSMCVSKFVRFDATTVGSTVAYSMDFMAAFGDTQFYYSSIAISSSGYLTVAWDGVVSAYGTGQNVRSVRSTDGGTTWTKQSGAAGVDQITTGTGSSNYQFPMVAYNSSNIPVIIFNLFSGGAMYRSIWTGAAWSTATIGVSAQTTSYPSSIILKKFGSSAGRLWLVISDGSLHVSVGYSDDGGSTWSTFVAVNADGGYPFPCITEKPNGDVVVFYQNASYALIYQTCANGGITFAGATSLGITCDNTYPPVPHTVSICTNNRIGWAYVNSANQIYFDKWTYNSAPTAPTGLTCANFDATASKVMTWTFNDPDIGSAGDHQTAYRIIVTKVSDGSVIKDTGKVTGATSSYTLPANTCANGVQYQWKVLTYDTSDAVSPYSSLATFNCSAPPIATITFPITDADVLSLSSLTPTWTFSDPGGNAQLSYQLQLTSTSDAVLWDSGVTTDTTSRSRTIPYTLINLTSYKVKITVWNAMGIASAQAVRTFSTSFIIPAQPTIVVAPVACHIDITITNPAPTGGQPVVTGNDLYRRELGTTTWVRIATLIFGTYSDYALASNQVYEYKVTALGDNVTVIDSDISQESITLQGIWIHAVNNPAGTTLNIPIHQNKAEVWMPEVVMAQYAGRKNLVANFGEFEDFKFNVNIRTKQSQALWSQLKTLARLKTILCARDDRGRKIFGVITGLSETDDFYGQSLPLEVIQVDYSEVV